VNTATARFWAANTNREGACHARNSWMATASMSTERASLTATRLGNGSVLVVGGEYDSTRGSTAELYDPATSITGASGLFGVAIHSG
jgi:hypothetical protein